jgi:hypothetical protein
MTAAATAGSGQGRSRKLVPALLRRLPLLKRARTAPIVDPATRAQFPELGNDLEFLDKVLVPKFAECDHIALVEQNRHRRQQLVLALAGSAGAVLGAVQAAHDALTWPGIALGLVTALSVAFARQVHSARSLQRYLDHRSKAERLRSLYFMYVLRVADYSGTERRQKLREDVKDLLTQEAS